MQQGGELAYLEVLDRGIPGHCFSFSVVSAAPEAVIQSALHAILPPDRIFGSRFEILHGNHRDGFTVAVSEARLGDAHRPAHDPRRRRARRARARSRGRGRLRPDPGAFFAAHGLSIREWDRVRTDRLSIDGPAGEGMAGPA